MVAPREKLAASLKALQRLQDDGVVAIRSAHLSRVHRERLIKNGFLSEAMKGWYVAARPGESGGESTRWYASFWRFCAEYLHERFGDDWCLSPEQSLSLHAGNWTVPRQLLVRAPRGGNKPTELPHRTSLLDVRASVPDEKEIEELGGLRVFGIPAALVAGAAGYFQHHPTDARAVLATIADASALLERLLEGGHSTIAGRLAGAFRNIGRDRIADEIVETMGAAGYDTRELDPFARRVEITLPDRTRSAPGARIRLMWSTMRAQVIGTFPPPPERRTRPVAYLKQVQEQYLADAYHSLSIEGYRVSPELIERVRAGEWNPERDERDCGQGNALAARGYWQAFQAVRASLRRVLKAENPGRVADQDHSRWYRELFAPAVAAGLVRASDLAGYRSAPVYIAGSMHVPPPHPVVRDVMPVFFELLERETDPAVRAVLAHFVFVYIHPYSDGNGRIGRFLMNVMLAAGGYPWLVIPVQQRAAYMAALEAASVKLDIAPLTAFLAKLVRAGLRGKPVANVPNPD